MDFEINYKIKQTRASLGDLTGLRLSAISRENVQKVPCLTLYLFGRCLFNDEFRPLLRKRRWTGIVADRV